MNRFINLMLKRIFWFFIAVAFLSSACKKSNRIIFDVQPNVTGSMFCQHSKTGEPISDSIVKAKLFLEASIGMKGYINPSNVADAGFALKTVLPKLITDLISKGFDVETYAIHNVPPRRLEHQMLISRTESGDIFNGGTEMRSYFPFVIDGNADNEISFLLSDFIYDNVGTDNVGVLRGVSEAIYTSLNRNNQSALVFMYYSDFDSRWYYNMNTNVTPFRNTGIIMKQRPFYIWVIGGPGQLRAILEKDIFSGYQQAFSYGLFSDEEFKSGLLTSYKTGKVAISQKSSDVIIYKQKPGDEVSVLIGLKLDGFPPGLGTTDYINDNLELSKSYLKDNISFSLFDKNSFLSSKRNVLKQNSYLKLSKEAEPYTHLLEMVFIDIKNVPDDAFSLIMKYKQPGWISNANIDDDRLINAAKIEQLETKTPLFHVPSGAFADKYLKRECNIFEIVFTKK